MLDFVLHWHCRVFYPDSPATRVLVEESNRVLIVDDRTDIRLFLRDFLYAEGFSTLEAADADQAVQSAHAHRPSLILMDVMMPGRDGLSAGSRDTRSR